MKLIKIGSDPSCNIVLNSEYVSAHHADLTILDNGDIFIEDKDSTNGTFLGKKKLNPLQEVQVRRGDLIKLGDETLVWSLVPSPADNSKYKTIVNIGANLRNDIVIDNNRTVSRYHASLKITPKGKSFIVDNGSKNGTIVNGNRIAPDRPVQIKRDDIILCGSEDVTERLKMYIASPTYTIILKSLLGVALIALLVGIGIFAWTRIKPVKSLIQPDEYLNSVVYVLADYYYEVKVKDNPLTVDQNKEILIKRTSPQPYQATAFFLDREGRLGTNRHVALPWAEEYRELDNEALRASYNEWLVNELNVSDFDPSNKWSCMQVYNKLKKTELGQILMNESTSFQELKTKIERIRKSEIIIEGAITNMMVGYPGQNYTHIDEFERCSVIEVSDSKDIDLAILQLNKKQTPSTVKHCINPLESYTEKITPMAQQLYTIGYPNGILWALDGSTHSLEPQLKETKCSKNPGKYVFEFDASSVGGSSGSPVITEKGELIGVLSSGYIGTTVTKAVLAKYLKQMYSDAVDSLN
ncbi:MAG: FHA domain-containing protein [Clostridia bacterium]|nr:FHA domain-containing protein [Clostridia bacterium]